MKNAKQKSIDNRDQGDTAIEGNHREDDDDESDDEPTVKPNAKPKGKNKTTPNNKKPNATDGDGAGGRTDVATTPKKKSNWVLAVADATDAKKEYKLVAQHV